MKILIVNTYDRGGAANSCKRLHLGLLLKGMDSKVLLKSKQKNWPKCSEFMFPDNLLSTQQKIRTKFKRIFRELKIYSPKSKKDVNQDFLNNREKGLELYSFPNFNIDITESDLYKEADVINLHWVANFLDYESFFKKNKKPVVWTLHDMNPFSGGEHYEEIFLGIDENGNPIERQKTELEIKLSNKNLALKQEILSKVDNLTIVAPSKWLVQEAQKSEVFKGFKIHYIPYGLDPNIYKPRKQDYSRDILNIPQGKKVVLFVADSISNNRKGFIFLKKALEQLNDSNLVLCAIGSKNSSFKSFDNIIELGSINDERLMSIAYSAADVFVIPSLMDNLPNTVLESLMCGTPVIGFPVGGILDMIQHAENGYITDEISVQSLKSTLSKFLTAENNFDRLSIRENAIKKYDQKIQADNYISLFNDIFDTSKEYK